MRFNPAPEVIFGDADEGLFVNTDRLGEICECVGGKILTKFSGLLRVAAGASYSAGILRTSNTCPTPGLRK